MIRGAVYGVTAASIWGGMYVVSDVVLQTIPPFTLLTLRLIFGGLALALIWRFVTQSAVPKRSNWLRYMAIGIIGFGISLGAQFIGTDRSTAINGAVITSATPIFVVAFARWILDERLTPRKVLAIALASIGVLLILNPRDVSFGSATFMGDLFLVLAAVTWGLYSVLARKVSDVATDTVVLTLGACVGGLLVAVPASVIELNMTPMGEISFGVILGVLYLGIFSTALAFWLWNRAFVLVEASVASLFFFAQPLTGVLLSTIFLRQIMTTALWAGSILILCGVLLIIMPKRFFTSVGLSKLVSTEETLL